VGVKSLPANDISYIVIACSGVFWPSTRGISRRTKSNSITISFDYGTYPYGQNATQTVALVDGTYKFTGLAGGTYSVSAPANAGAYALETTSPLSVNLPAGGSSTGNNFGYIDSKTGTISGTLYVDANGNLSFDTGEPVLAGVTVTLKNVRPPAKTLSLSAEAAVDASDTGKATLADLVEETVEKNKNLLPLSQVAVAFVFGPENGAVSQKLVFEAAKEAYAKSYAHLYVIGFAIQPTARELIEKCTDVVGVPATYVQATPDLLMGDLLKNMRSSQIFSVCGLPEVEVSRLADGKCQVKLLGLDVFDPVTMNNDTRDGNDVPCWLLDADYNDLCFHVSQAFFPRTGAWENLKRALRGEYDESVWAHLAGTTSAPFEPGENRKIAVKVIDDRGNELLVVKPLEEAGK